MKHKIKQEKKSGIKQEKKSGIEQEKKSGIEQEKKSGIEQEKKAGIEQEKKSEIEQEKKSKQYILNSNGTSTAKEVKLTKEKIEYDDIVDKSHYVTNKETIRQTRITSDTSGGQTPVYDDHEPTQLEIALRSGKLDKADVHQIQLKMQEEIKTESQKQKTEALDKARQDYLDKATGFISEAQK